MQHMLLREKVLKSFQRQGLLLESHYADGLLSQEGKTPKLLIDCTSISEEASREVREFASKVNTKTRSFQFVRFDFALFLRSNSFPKSLSNKSFDFLFGYAFLCFGCFWWFLRSREVRIESGMSKSTPGKPRMHQGPS